jgi:hypothetical protein
VELDKGMRAVSRAQERTHTQPSARGFLGWAAEYGGDRFERQPGVVAEVVPSSAEGCAVSRAQE